MAVRPIDARRWLFEIEDLTGTWLPIKGKTSFTLNPGENRENTEITDFDSGGFYEEDVMQVGASLALEGRYEADPVTGAQDPGQAYVAAMALRMSTDSHNRIRYRHETVLTWAVWDATVNPGEQGGGNNDKTSWSATFTRNGPATSMAV
ncbi:phage tail tube protein [Kitasatospora sp. NPDC004289]